MKNLLKNILEGNDIPSILADVKDNKAPYLIRSLIYNMLDILYWCRVLPSNDSRNKTILAVKQAKELFELEQKQRKQNKS